MVSRETAHTIADQPPFVRDWAREWHAAEKIVFSRTLAEPRRARTRIKREFDAERSGGSSPRSSRPSPSTVPARDACAPRGHRGRGADDPLPRGNRWRKAVLPGRRAARSGAGRGARIRQRSDGPAVRRPRLIQAAREAPRGGTVQIDLPTPLRPGVDDRACAVAPAFPRGEGTRLPGDHPFRIARPRPWLEAYGAARAFPRWRCSSAPTPAPGSAAESARRVVAPLRDRDGSR